MARIRSIDWECWSGQGYMLPAQFINLIRMDVEIESPIEKMLGAELIWRLSQFAEFAACMPEHEEYPTPRTLLLMPQYQWRMYRIDWVIGCRQGYVFIECDGHDFHERTKEQAEHDRSRDRAIQAAGIPVLRFTGPEIHRDVDRCCSEIMQCCGKFFCGRHHG